MARHRRIIMARTVHTAPAPAPSPPAQALVPITTAAPTLGPSGALPTAGLGADRGRHGCAGGLALEPQARAAHCRAAAHERRRRRRRLTLSCSCCCCCCCSCVCWAAVVIRWARGGPRACGQRPRTPVLHELAAHDDGGKRQWPLQELSQQGTLDATPSPARDLVRAAEACPAFPSSIS
jgi:hypothetical protein